MGTLIMAQTQCQEFLKAHELSNNAAAAGGPTEEVAVHWRPPSIGRLR